MPGALETAVLLGAMAASATLTTVGVVRLRREGRLGDRLASLGRRPAPSLSVAPAETGEPLLLRLLIGAGKDREEVERYLAAGGPVTPHSLLAFALVRVLAPIVAAGASLALLHGPAAPFVAVTGACVAFLAPKQLLRFQGGRRIRRLNAELPFTLDVLTMMLESGVSIEQCFRTFAQSEGRGAPLVRAATRLLVRDIELGTPYELALARWADRIGVPGARELATVITRSLNHGTPLARVMKEFSIEFSARRVAMARETIGRRSTQMTLTMLILIMPSLFIVLAGPAVATLGKAVRSMGGGP